MKLERNARFQVRDDDAFQRTPFPELFEVGLVEDLEGFGTIQRVEPGKHDSASASGPRRTRGRPRRASQRITVQVEPSATRARYLMPVTVQPCTRAISSSFTMHSSTVLQVCASHG